MAKYNKIFWLEDMPDFLEAYFYEATRIGLKKDDLFARVTWAHDFEEGAMKVNETYDLHILDADFPDVCEPEHRQKTEEYLKMIQSNKWEYWKRLRCMDDTETNNFAKFYRKFLAENKCRIVVLSMSTVAPIVAFALGLPFYSKFGFDKTGIKDYGQLWKDHIKREKEMKDEDMDRICAKAGFDRKDLDFKLLENYECGGGIDFIKRYLL